MARFETRRSDATGGDGWTVRVVAPEMIEYCWGEAVALVNVGRSIVPGLHEIYASESASEHFPYLVHHLRTAARRLGGTYVVI